MTTDSMLRDSTPKRNNDRSQIHPNQKVIASHANQKGNCPKGYEVSAFETHQMT